MAKKEKKIEIVEETNSPKYIVVRPIRFDCKLLLPGDEIIGMEQRRLNVMVRFGFAKIVDENIKVVDENDLVL